MTFCILIERERERDGGKSYGSSNNVEDKKFDAATQSTRIQCVCWYKMKQKKKKEVVVPITHLVVGVTE